MPGKPLYQTRAYQARADNEHGRHSGRRGTCKTEKRVTGFNEAQEHQDRKDTYGHQVDTKFSRNKKHHGKYGHGKNHYNIRVWHNEG
jgi:hypothetical protein